MLVPGHTVPIELTSYFRARIVVPRPQLDDTSRSGRESAFPFKLIKMYAKPAGLWQEEFHANLGQYKNVRG